MVTAPQPLLVVFLLVSTNLRKIRKFRNQQGASNRREGHPRDHNQRKTKKSSRNAGAFLFEPSSENEILQI